MNQKNERTKPNELSSTVFFLGLILCAILIAFTIYEKTHPKFDENISGKEATVVSEVAKIYYDDPLGRNVDTVTKSQKVNLTGKMQYLLQSDIVMMQIHLEDNSFAWISKKDIFIPE